MEDEALIERLARAACAVKEDPDHWAVDIRGGRLVDVPAWQTYVPMVKAVLAAMPPHA